MTEKEASYLEASYLAGINFLIVSVLEKNLQGFDSIQMLLDFVELQKAEILGERPPITAKEAVNFFKFWPAS